MPLRATGARRSRRTPATTAATLATAALLGAAALTGCQSDATSQGSNLDPAQVDALEPPETGECRMLTTGDIGKPSNASATVPCVDPHTAETFAAGTLPAEFDDAAYDDQALGPFAFEVCGREFMDFLGADESLAMRSILSWTMFRPSETAWDRGARWYRCDVIGGGPGSRRLVTLPDEAEGLLRKPADKWLACVKGRSVATSPRVPCAERHTYRAVTTIRLGKPEDAFPGDKVVANRTRSFCGDSVAAWLGYPARYSYAYTWFPQSDWEAGNRRSVCWARTDQ